MVSTQHEGLVQLVRDRPAFAAELLGELHGVEIPPFREARMADSTLNHPAGVEIRSDAAVLFEQGPPVFGVIVEAQLQDDNRKHYTWPLYAITARARHECPFAVLVFAPDPPIARWAGRPIDLGGGWTFCPRVIGPDLVPKLTDRDRACADPQLAVLSTIVHGRGDVDTAVRIAAAAFAAADRLPKYDQRLLYLRLIEDSVSDKAREELSMQAQPKRLMDELQGRYIAQGREEGRVEGRVEGRSEGLSEALLKLLAQRGLAVSESQQQTIATCTDISLLDRWLGLALSVSSVDELLR